MKVKKMKIKREKMTGLVLAWVFLPVFVFSCSAKERTWGRENFPGSHGQESITQFVSGVRPYQGNRDAHYRLACYYQEQGNHKEALVEFGKVLLIDPRDVKALNGTGISCDQRRDFRGALEAYQRALEIDPRLDYVLNNLGYSYLLQGKPAEAIPVLEKAVALNGKENRFHNNLGLAYALDGRLDPALAEFKRAGEESRAHYNIARFYSERGLYSAAKFHYSAALSLDPSFLHARTALAAVDALKGIFRAVTPQRAEESSAKAEPAKAELQERVDREADPAVEARAAIADPNSPSALLRPVEPENREAAEMNPEQQKSGEVSSLAGFPLPALSPAAPGAPQEKVSPKERRVETTSSSLNQVDIEISNGNGVNRMARRLGRYLEEKGLKVTRFTNADHFRYPDTIIYYQQGYQETAQKVAKELPGQKNTELCQKFDRPHVKVKVVIGRDIIPHKEKFKEG